MTQERLTSKQKKKDKVMINNRGPAAPVYPGAATLWNLAEVNQEKLIHALLLARRSSKIQQAEGDSCEFIQASVSACVRFELF
ncbi:hypothetical protein R1flu_015229 [Riccia fluitans]|uniref:Uncharacterized protein n=1 Tax=Riccia fluitans TaxID=41844 RepID=A0ABD1YIB6_9MARC